MTIQIEQITDLENFEHIRFAFTMRKSALKLDPDLIKGVTLDLRMKFDREEYYLMGFRTICKPHILRILTIFNTKSSTVFGLRRVSSNLPYSKFCTYTVFAAGVESHHLRWRM